MSILLVFALLICIFPANSLADDADDTVLIQATTEGFESQSVAIENKGNVSISINSEEFENPLYVLTVEEGKDLVIFDEGENLCHTKFRKQKN